MNVKERAAALLAELAQDLHDSHTVNGDWRGDTDAQSSYNQMLTLCQGLKAGIHLITATPVEPDSDGFWAHPGIPDHLDEDPAPFERWLNEQLLECVTREVGDEDGGVVADWEDSKPAAAGWFLLQLIEANKAGQTPMDLCISAPVDVMRGNAAGLWRAYDAAQIPNLSNLPDSYVTRTPEGVAAVGAVGWFFTMVTNPQTISPTPTSWTELWAPGRRNAWGLAGTGAGPMYEVTAATYFDGPGMLVTVSPASSASRTSL